MDWRRPAGTRTNEWAAKAPKGWNALLLQEPAVFRREARDAAATVQQGLVAAGPRRVGLRVDVEVQRRAWLAVGRTRLIGRAVRHHHGDHVVVGMRILLHGSLLPI